MRALDTIPDRVCAALLKIVPEAELRRSDIAPQTSLIELGFDSLKFAELVGVLEDDLGIADFPMQAWIDEEGERADTPYTVGSLVEKCVLLLDKVGDA